MNDVFDKPAERVAADAGWIAGYDSTLQHRLAKLWGRCNRDRLLPTRCDEADLRWHGMLRTPAPEKTYFVSYVEPAIGAYEENTIRFADEAASFFLANGLLQLDVTPTYTQMKTYELFSNSVFDTELIAYVIGDCTAGLTVPAAGIEITEQPKQPLALIHTHTVEVRKPSRAFRMFSELREWLNLTTEETAQLVGVKRTTPHAWEREGREPRPAAARRLYQLHSIVGSLVKRLGVEAAAAWLEQGVPSPRVRLQHGQVDEVARQVETTLLTRSTPSTLPPREALAVEEDIGEVIPLRGGRRRRRDGVTGKEAQ